MVSKSLIIKIICDLNNISINEFVDKLKRMQEEDNNKTDYLKIILKNDGIREILLYKMINESNNNWYEYFYDKLKIDIPYILRIVSSGKNDIKLQDRFLLELFSYVTWKDINTVLKYALNNKKFYDIYFDKIKYFYSLCYNIKYEIILEYLKRDINIVKDYFYIYKEDYIKLFLNDNIDLDVKKCY